MQNKNIYGLPTQTVSPLDEQLKSLQKQKENLEKRFAQEGINTDTLKGGPDNRNILEKALNLTPDQGVLLDFFEILDRPVQAVKGAIRAGYDGKTFVQGAFEGLSGKSKISGKEVLGFDKNVDYGPIANFALDVGIDIALDPLTYLPAGFLFKNLKKATTKTLSKVVQKTDALYIKKLTDIVAKKEAGETLVDTIQRISLDDATDEVLALGTGDFDPVAYASGANRTYSNNINSLKARTDYLLDLYENGKVVNGYFEGTGGAIVNGKIQEPLRYSAATKAELGYYKKLKDSIEAANPNLRVVLTSTSNQKPDLEILRRFADTDNFVRIDSIEIKKLTDSRVATRTIKGFDAATGKFIFSEGLNPRTIERFSSFASTATNADGDTLETVIKRVYNNNKRPDQNVTVAFKDFIKGNADLEEELKDIILDMATDNGVNEFAFSAIDGRDPILLTREEVKKYVSFEGSVYWQSSGRTQSFTNKVTQFKDIAKKIIEGTLQIDISKPGIKAVADILQENGIETIEALDAFDALKYFKNQRSQFRFSPSLKMSKQQYQKILADGIGLSAEQTISRYTTETLDRTVGIIEYTAEATELVGTRRQAVAKAANNFIKNFKALFNSTAFFSQDGVNKFRQVFGESMFELERRSQRLVSIKQEALAIDEKAGVLLGELVEAGAYLDEAGNIAVLDRKFGFNDFLDSVFKRLGDGLDVYLPEFADEGKQLNFINKLNAEYFDAMGVEDAFSIKPKGQSRRLVFNDTNDNLLDFAKKVGEPDPLTNIIKDRGYLEFGNKPLSDGAKNLIKTAPQLVKEYQVLSDDIIQDLVSKANYEQLPESLTNQIGYMRHALTKDALALLKQQYRPIKSNFAKKASDSFADRVYMGSAQEINQALRDFGGSTVDTLEVDAFKAMEDLIHLGQRKVEQHQMLEFILNTRGANGEAMIQVIPNTQQALKEFGPDFVAFKNFEEEFPTLMGNLSPKARETFGNFLEAIGLGSDTVVLMNRSARDALKRTERAFIDLPPIVKIYDKFLNLWKGLTLVTPGFHLRNLFGNSFNSYAVGMDLTAQMRYSTVAFTELSEWQQIGKKLARGENLSAAEQELFETVKGYFDKGVSQTHRGVRDLENVVEASAAKGGIKEKYGDLVRLNFNIAEKMDDFQRYALYRWALDKNGGDTFKAAQIVAESLFDYSHLTPFEREYMKRIFPFYTFMKNNFVFQYKNILANPKQYARTGRAYKYATEDLAGFTQEDMPDYANENMWLPIPMTLTKNDKKAIAFLKTNLPISDFTELIENPFAKGVTSITTPVKLLIELGAGRDLFTGAPLQNFPGEKNAMEKGTGVLSFLRDERGNLTITQSPIFQKIINDIGLRTPINYASVGVDLLDTLTGYQGPVEGLGDFLARMGLVAVQDVDKLQLTKLYQDLNKLRNLKKFYEQETGNQLPVLPRG